MYSGFLPKGLTEEDLSPEEDEQERGVEEQREGEDTETCRGKLISAGKNKDTLVDAESLPTISDANSESPTCSLPGISQEMWQVCC